MVRTSSITISLPNCMEIGRPAAQQLRVIDFQDGSLGGKIRLPVWDWVMLLS